MALDKRQVRLEEPPLKMLLRRQRSGIATSSQRRQPLPDFLALDKQRARQRRRLVGRGVLGNTGGTWWLVPEEEGERHSVDTLEAAQLDHIDAPLARFALRHEGLWFAEPSRGL